MRQDNDLTLHHPACDLSQRAELGEPAAAPAGDVCQFTSPARLSAGDASSPDLSVGPIELSWPAAMKGVAALLALNALLSFGPWWPTPGIVLQARLAPEVVGLWLIPLWLAARAPMQDPQRLWALSGLV